MSDVLENTPDLWRDLFPFPLADSHKYSRGTALIRGGEIMTGAARLAARAAQRMGAGLVTLAVPVKALPIYAVALESVIVRPCDTTEEWQGLVDDPRQAAILIGPGLGLGAARAEEVLAALATQHPCVLDADALTNFAERPEVLLGALHKECVLTPHEGEFSRLFGGAGEDRVARARAAAKRAGCPLVLKGAETIIAAPNGVVILNRNAPPWLATAGSGDVLAGMILGLVAQKMSVFWAAVAAVWLHGRCADLYGAGLIAEDIVETLPQVLGEVL